MGDNADNRPWVDIINVSRLWDPEDIEGMGQTPAERVREQGVLTGEQLVARCATPEGRADLAAGSGVSEKLLSRWADFVVLSSLPGVGEQHLDLLEAAGVDSVAELAGRRPESLHREIADANREKKLAETLPDLNQVGEWIEAAKLSRG
jgi:hypothetical protein